MIRWCCYCQKVLGEKAPFDNPEFSHGICAACAEKLESDERLPTYTVERRVLIDRLLVAARDADESACIDIVSKALQLGLDTESILVGMLQPALYQAGLDWHEGRMSYEAEHRLSEWCERVFAMLDTSPPDGMPVDMLIFRTPGNLHTIGPRFAARALIARGWSVKSSEAALTVDEMAACAKETHPRFIGFSCALPAAVPVAVDLITQLRARLEPDVSTRYVLSGFAFRLGGGTTPTIPPGIQVAIDLESFRELA